MKPDTYTQLYIQLVFSPNPQTPVYNIESQEELFKYTSNLIDLLGHKSLGVNGMHDHIHIFYGMKPDISVSDTVKEIKRFSTSFLKEKGLVRGFNWQHGFGAFSYSRSQLNNVITYIKNQKEHHKKFSFEDEYKELLKRFEIDFNEKYLFDFSHRND